MILLDVKVVTAFGWKGKNNELFGSHSSVCVATTLSWKGKNN